MNYVWERRNAYEILELDRDATETDIKRAFRLQSKAWHPDGFDHLDAEAQTEVARRIEAIREARDTLLDPDEREDIDIDIDLEQPDADWFTQPDQRNAELWKAMARWMKLEDLGTGFDRKMAFQAGDLIERRKRPSDKQIPHMLRVWDESFGEGFSPSIAEGLE